MRQPLLGSWRNASLRLRTPESEVPVMSWPGSIKNLLPAPVFGNCDSLLRPPSAPSPALCTFQQWTMVARKQVWKLAGSAGYERERILKLVHCVDPEDGP